MSKDGIEDQNGGFGNNILISGYLILPSSENDTNTVVNYIVTLLNI